MSKHHVRMAVAMLAAAVTVAGSAAAAAPGPAPGKSEPGKPHTRSHDEGRAEDRDAVAGTDAQRVGTPRGTNRAGRPGTKPLAGPAPRLDDSGSQPGYPRQTQLRTYPEDPTEKTLKLGLTPYYGIAPKLNALQAASDRVSVEVTGQSTLGRDMYLVTVTAPESPIESRLQARWRDLIADDPVRAAREPLLRQGYKAPLLINANIHGHETEGTDVALQLIERLSTATDAATVDLLRHHRIYLNVTANPDGRAVMTRPSAAGFDLNRDLLTASQPESVATRNVFVTTQALMMVDLHGFGDPGPTIIEPAGPPHGQSYDYDLYIKHGYPNAIGMEKAVLGLGYPDVTKVDFPFRDYGPGEWDDWAPIYTQTFGMLLGIIGQTVEMPLRTNNAPYDTLPVEELRRRVAVNSSVAHAAVNATLAYAAAHREQLVADRIELSRRGAAGEAQPQIPDGFVPGFGPEDRSTTTFARGYVIPAGAGQRSERAAARLVDHLTANRVRVVRADAAFTAGGRSYPAGSYVVDLHQPRRAMANAMLEDGGDLSARVPTEFDISGWSFARLWGASVDTVASGELPVTGQPVTAAAPTGGVDPAPGLPLAIAPRDGADIAAVNDLLGQGLALRRRTDGTVLVPASARPSAIAAASRYGVRFTAAPAGDQGSALHKPVLAAAVAPEELVAWRGMGFETRPISTAVLNAGFDWSRVDVVVVSAGLSWAQLNEPARAALRAFLTRGGVVTRGAVGSTFNAEAGLLPVTVSRGPVNANGVVRVTGGDPDAHLGAGAPDHSFAYAPQWFTGSGVTVEQRYADRDVVAAGHWLPNADGSGGPEQAAGKPAVVSGQAGGARVVLFGTEPLFRDHPKGLYAQIAQAAYWAG
jgi:hypothetical protein